MTHRPASHAGSWYSDDGPTLSKQLDQWLDQVPSTIDIIGGIPQPGARIIIAPYELPTSSPLLPFYTVRAPLTSVTTDTQATPTPARPQHGPTNPSTSRARKLPPYLLPLSFPPPQWNSPFLRPSINSLPHSKRIFLLGPSHHAYLPNLALSQHTTYATPLGPLPLDLPTIQTLHETGHFGKMSPRTDEDEHSLEMHLPYIHKVLSRTFPNPTSDDDNAASFPPLIPILVGNTSPAAEKTYGKLLAPYLADPTSVFVVSSDFCHWGARFSYTYYIPSPPSATSPVPFPIPTPPSPSSSSSSSSATQTPSAAAPATPSYHLSAKSQSKPRPGHPIHASIAHVDTLSMRAIESGSHDALLANLRETENTVCGRHPIGVVMAALEVLGSEEGGEEVGKDSGEELGAREEGLGKKGKMAKGRFRFIRYERSSDCVSVRDSSVSYASAFAVV